MTSRSIALALVCFVGFVAPVSAHDEVTGTPDVTITLRGGGLSDRDVRVPAGGIVRFVNRDDDRHRLRSRSGPGFDTGDIEPGETSQVRLAAPGTYTYIDEREDEDTRYHGRIVVGARVATPGNGGGGAAGNGAAGTGNAAGNGAVGSKATVTIGDRIFQPTATTIAVGGTVTFRNADGDEHTATGGPIDSGTLAPGASYTTTFADAGTYDFLCIFHPEMQGSIQVVGAATAPEPAPTPTPKPTPTPAPTSTPGTPSGDAVDIVDLAFEPAELEVSVGTTVTWTNTGLAPHTATADDETFDSGTLETGGTFQHTFTAVGTFPYLCRIHPDMTGTVVVVDTTAAQAPAAAASDAPTEPPPPEAASEPQVDARTASTELGSLTGIALAVTMVSIAGALFARLLRGTVRTPDA